MPQRPAAKPAWTLPLSSPIVGSGPHFDTTEGGQLWNLPWVHFPPPHTILCSLNEGDPPFFTTLSRPPPHLSLSPCLGWPLGSGVTILSKSSSWTQSYSPFQTPLLGTTPDWSLQVICRSPVLLIGGPWGQQIPIFHTRRPTHTVMCYSDSATAHHALGVSTY